VVGRDSAPGRAAGERIVIHLERVPLPPGLRAVAYRDKRGNLVIYVSETLDAACQRAAVVEAIRASRRSEWRHGGLPSAAIVLLLGIRTVLWRAAGALKARPVAWGTAATTAVAGASAAGVFITAVPHHPSSASRRPEPSAVQPLTPQAQPPGRASHQVHARAAAAPGSSAGRGQAAAAERRRPTPASAGSSPTPTPAPSALPSPTPTQPAPSPSPSGRICVVVLGIRVCVG
jgi:hypothetical protein